MKRGLLLFLICLFSLGAKAQTVDDLVIAVAEDHVDDMIKALKVHSVNQKDPSGNSLLIIAAFEGSHRCFKELMKRNPDVNAKNTAGDTAIMIAALKGDKDMVAPLIAAGANLNPAGWTPLLYAATNGHTDIIKMLIEKGANIDAAAPNGLTPLMMAAKGGHLQAVKALVWSGAALNKKTETGMTARKFALSMRNTDIAEILTRAGATE